MDSMTRTAFDNLRSDDKDVQNQAFEHVLAVTEHPVDWAYEVWDDMVADLKHKDNHRRAIAAQVLCNLAKSDPDQRMLKDFDALLNVTRDDRFVTARHTIQAIWKVGTVGKPQEQKLIDGLTGRFNECIAEKNCTLIRYDITQGFRNLYDAIKDEKVKKTALDLIETETDLKYRKKYAGVWKA